MNPFNRTLDWVVRGKRAHVRDASGHEYEGWIDRVHHGQQSVVLRDATNLEEDRDVGGVYVREVDAIEVLEPRRTIEHVAIDDLHPHPLHPLDFEIVDDHLRRAYRNDFVGSFPVVRERPEDGGYEVLNGHKRVAAAEAAGLERHPVELIDVDDSTSAALFELAHQDESEGERTAD